ncbi:hypothetical protein JOD64_003589 [Micromonospora luteifusca]|uniref:Uncharacterized protein n=1 Tax=Micromonospora luteifusca TaxID=709860 RepID=A0ABS2LWM4_9ACTN|nr:hypothetical protein [Micromonospora luteifusca]MBM7492367.1 hypothetical protein [Micromonospora luteifusca]
MVANPLRVAPGASGVETIQRSSSLDYYLVLPRHDDRDPTTAVEGILVEEFTRQHDHSTTGLDNAGWTSESGWWSSASLSRAIRTDPEMLARVVPTSRREAESVYRTLGGGQLPDDTVLRTYFLDHQSIANAPPLRLGPEQPPAGFHERRVYRVLFAKELRAEQVTSLRVVWRPPAGGTSASAASGHLEKDGDEFAWDLRRVGHTLAWCLDVTVLLSTATTDAVGAILSDLTTVLRQHGLIPVTTERFA